MQLRWFGFDDVPSPVQSADVALGELTVVVGANDAGKTRLVRTLESALAGAPDVASGFVVVEVSPSDRRVLFAAAGLAHDEASVLRRYDKPEVGVSVSSWGVLRDALHESCVFAFVVDHPGEMSLHWCVDLGGDASMEVREAAQDLVAARAAAGIAEAPRGGADDAAPSAGPIVGVVCLGKIPVSHLPEPVFLPARGAELVARATRVIDELARHLDWYSGAEGLLRSIAAEAIPLDELPAISEAIVDALTTESGIAPQDVSGFGEGPWDELYRRGGPGDHWEAWLEQTSTQALRVKDGVTRACRVIGDIATRLAPQFVGDRYAVDVQVTPRSLLGDGSPLRVGLRNIEPTSEPPNFFGIDEVADGYRIWIQLSLLAAIEALSQPLRGFFQLADDIVWLVFTLQAVPSPPVLFLGWSGFTVPEGVQDFDDARDLLPKLARRYLDAMSDFLEGRAPHKDAPLGIAPPIGGTAPLRPPVFLIDEPEQHLHPRAQRQLATWLGDFVRRYRTQAILITHSVPFVQEADTIIYVKRSAGRSGNSRATGIPAEEISALSDIGSDLGLNRGELLASVSLFLFVEGESDRIVLERLFGERLRRLGVAVVPLHGVRQLRQILDATVLLRYSTAHVAILIDALKEHPLHDLIDDPAKRAEAMSAKATEDRELAKLLDDATKQGREPAVIVLPERDIFFTLDETAVRDTFRDLASDHEPYPGHEALKKLADRKKVSWKTLTAERFGIPKTDVVWYATVSDRMVAAASYPPILADIVDQIERLTVDPGGQARLTV